MDSERRTVLVDRYRASASSTGGANAYRGLRIHALPGLHDFLGAAAVKYLPSQARVLDLAAGSGALSLRLQDLGFRVQATDYVAENFRLPDIAFRQADLNAGFSEGYAEPFDAIVASEIIEHLENPRHFARECFRLLAPGGRLLLSTPNLENAGAKAAFVRSGRFLWFDDQEYAEQGHISPLTQWQILRSFVEAGFRDIWCGSFGKGASRVNGSPRLQILAKLIDWLTASPASMTGEIFVAVFERARHPPH